MTSEQRNWYEQVKNDVLDEVEEWDSYTIFKLFSRLQQIVCGFLNAYGMTFEHSRVDHLLDIIERIPDREKVIIWCKYEDDIRQITQAIGRDNLALFYGRLKPAERDREVSLFRKNRRFFLATQATGGHGLTLNEACHVIYYNNTFKYAERIQSEDRCHRIGQTRPVTYVDLVCSDSIDGRIMTAIENKGSVVDEFKRKVDAVKGNKPAIKEMIKSL
jgi:SNF2 family DNA or RNA helicase